MVANDLLNDVKALVDIVIGVTFLVGAPSAIDLPIDAMLCIVPGSIWLGYPRI